MLKVKSNYEWEDCVIYDIRWDITLKTKRKVPSTGLGNA